MMGVIDICHICQESKLVKAIFDLNSDVFNCVFGNKNYNEHYLVCSKCFRTIEKLFEFKRACLEVESKIKLMCGPRKEAHLEIWDITGIDVKSQEFVCNLNVCRICLEFYKNSACMVSVTEPDFKLKLNKCLPEMNINNVKDPVGCEKCCHMVEQYFSVLQCFVDKKVKCEAVYDEEFPLFDDNLKQEEVDIKDEQQESNAHDSFDEDGDKRSSLLLRSQELYGRGHGTQLIQEVHEGIHGIEKVIKYEVCEKSFAQRSHTKELNMILTREKLLKCDICEKQFIRKRSLSAHARIHREKALKCDICDKCFTIKGNFIEHMKTHRGENPFKCDICDKWFLTKGNLIVHMKIHTSEKTFKCDVCDKWFRTIRHLIVHMRIHRGEKPFKCDICDQCFTLKGDLTVHMRIHTGEKLFKCDMCDKRFTQKRSLIVHWEKTHKAKTFD